MWYGHGPVRTVLLYIDVVGMDYHAGGGKTSRKKKTAVSNRKGCHWLALQENIHPGDGEDGITVFFCIYSISQRW